MDVKNARKKLNWSSVLLAAFFILVVFGFFAGIRPCAVVSGSMEPNLPTWSLCFVDTRISYDDIKTGDIVVYIRRSDEKRIIHRVIDIQPEGMVTKGDANSVSDGLSVGRDNLYGKSLFHIPYLGYINRFTQNPLIKALVILAITALVVLDIASKVKERRVQNWLFTLWCRFRF